MKKIRIVSLYIVLVVAAMSVSSCVYHSRAPYYDNGYGYGYGYRHPPRTIIVRPTPPPITVYRNSPRSYRNERRSHRYYNNQRNNRYGQNERSRGHR